MMMNLANEQKLTSFFAGEIEGKEPLLDEWEVRVSLQYIRLNKILLQLFSYVFS